MTVEGDAPPSDQDAADLFADYDAPRQSPQLHTYSPTIGDKVSGWLHDIRTSEPVEKIMGQTQEELEANPPLESAPPTTTQGVMGGFESTKPVLDVPENPQTFAEGLHATGANAVNSVASPLGVATLPLGGGATPLLVKQALGTIFGVQGAKMSYDSAKDLLLHAFKNSGAKNAEDLVNGLLGGLMAKGGIHVFKGAKPSETPSNGEDVRSPRTMEAPPAGEEQAPESAPAPTEPAESVPEAPPADLPPPYQPPAMSADEVNARLAEINKQREAGGFSGTTREEARLLKLKQQQDAAAPPAEPAPEEQLSPETEALLEAHKDAAGGAEIVTDDKALQANPDDPFAAGRDEGAAARMATGSPAWADKPNNRIVLARANLNAWLNSMPVDKRPQAMRSLLSEEKIHLAASDEDAGNYWNSLSGIEKWATRYKYNANESDLNMGHEALRYRMQQLMRMTPTEIAQEYGGSGAFRRRMSIHAVDALETTVRHIRHGLKGASPEQLAILGRVEDNLKTARLAAGGAIVQTQDNPYSKQASDEAKQLQQQAEHYRGLGMNDEADEMTVMAQKMGGWSKSEVVPETTQANQPVFDALKSRTDFENTVGARGRGRPTRDKINPYGKENLFAPSAFAAGGDLEVPEGHALPEGQATKLPTASEVEGGANKFLDKSIGESVQALESGKAFKTPDFKDFSDYMKRNYKTQPGQVKDLYQRGLVSRLQSASGETLSAMLKSVFGRDSILARMRVPDAEEGAGAKSKSFHQMFLDTTGEILDKARNPIESKGISESELRQQSRSKAIGMIAKKLMAPMMENDAGIIDRKEISPSEIRFSAGDEGESSSYQELSKQDEHNPGLGEILTDRNRRSNSDKASITRRLTVLRDRKTGELHMVSTWKNPATGRVFLTNPSLPRGEGVRLEEALHRYAPLRSILLDEPTEKFHKSYKDVQDYENKFGKEAQQNHDNNASYDPEATPLHEYEQGVEGTPEVESSSFQGPERKIVEAATGAGRSSVEESMRGRITKPEADAVSRAIAGAESPEEVKDILKKLGKESYDKLKFEFHRTAARLDKANTKLERAKAARLEPTKSTPEEQAERVHNAQQEVLKAQEESLKASKEFRQNAALRSGVTKIAKRFQNLYGKEWKDNPVAGIGHKIQVPRSGEDILNQLSKSLYNAHLTALSGRAPVDAILELGGDKKKSSFDKTVTPTGQDLSMRTPPSSRQFQERQFSNLSKVPPPKPEELTPAPPKPVETLDGGEMMRIAGSLTTPEQRQAGFNYKFTPEEEREIELEATVNQVRHDIYKRENAEAIEALKNKPFELKGEVQAGSGSVAPDPRVKTYPPRPVQTRMPLGAAGRKVADAVKEQAERLQGLGSAWNKRSDIEKWIAAGYDSFLTVAHNAARSAANSVRLLATKGGKENREMLGGAIAMRSANPFRKMFNYSPEALDAFEKEAAQHPDVQLSQTLLNQDAHGIKLHLRELMDKTTDQGKQAYYSKIIGDINSLTGPDKAVRNEKGQTIRWKGQPETVPSSVRMEGIRIGKEAERMIENKLVEDGLLNHNEVQYKFDPSYKYKLDTFLKQIRIGHGKAMEMMKSKNPFAKLQARTWMKDLLAHQKDVEYAKAHWGDQELQDTTLKAVKELDHQYDAEREAGTSLSYNDAYLPGRYQGQFHNNLSVVFGPAQILGRQFARGKAFKDPYDAASAGPYISASHDISDLVEHRIRQGAVKMGQKAWEGQLATIKDPATKQQAFATARYVDGRWVPELPVGADGANYETVSANASRAPMYALKGSYARLLDNLVSPSKVDKWAVTKAAMQAGQFLKHTALLGDFFHLTRITHYAGSIFGKGAYKFGSHIPGWAALDYRPEDLNTAVERGVISQKDVDWLNEKLPIKENGFKTTISRIELAKKFEKSGFNVGQISDAIYKDLVAHVPVLGRYNKFLFDRYTRGLMTRSAIEEYSRLQAKNPEAEASTLMRGISRDLNNYFGSIGKQGWIKSSTMQDMSRLLFLAPQWVEGIAKKDAAIPYKLAMAAKDGGVGGVANVLKGNDTIARGIARGMVSMFVLSQVINMITRRQPTWDNEEGHKFDADIGSGTFINPLSVFNEMLHEFIHYNETKPTAWEAIKQIGENKLGFFGRAALTLLTNKSPTGETQTSTMGALKQAALQLIPTPITGQPISQAIVNKVSGGRLAEPVQQAQLNKAAASFFGVKADIAPKLDFAMSQKAHQFVQANHLRNEATSPELTDQPSYSKLRHELTVGNTGGAKQILEDLRKNGVKDGEMIAAMKTWVKAPFTGSRRTELLWLHSMTPDERAQYHQAVAMKYDTYKQFVNFYINAAR